MRQILPMNPQNKKQVAWVAVFLAAVALGWWWLVRAPSLNPDSASLGRSEDVSAPINEDRRNTSYKSHSVKKPDNSFPPNDAFELPFLGKIPAHARQEQLKVETGGGKTLPLPMKVFYGEDGRFLRAEFFKEGARSFQFPAQQLQIGYESGGERILGIPTTAALVDLPSHLKTLYHHQPFDDATRINVTYIDFEKGDKKIGPVFSAEVWGVRDDFFREQHIEAFRKYRCILDAKGKLLFFSNAL